MRLRFKPPLIVLVVGLLGLILLLATLQYVWLGRISEAERERLRATLESRAAEFARDFDKELTHAYLLFQTEPTQTDQDATARFAEQYDRWQATSVHPRLLKDFHIATRERAGGFALRRFDPSTRTLIPASWPKSMADWRTRLEDRAERARQGGGQGGESSLVIRRLPGPIWETVPALVVPAPLLFLSGRGGPASFSPPESSYTLLTIDLDYIKNDLFPTLVQAHFRKTEDASVYQVAVVDRADADSVVYRSTTEFNPRDAESGDASAPLFQVRTQDFSAIAADMKRFMTFRTNTARGRQQGDRRDAPTAVRGSTRMSIVVQQGSGESVGRGASHLPGRAAPTAPRWQVIVKHPAGSLEAFVGSARRRNLIISSSILGVLAASMALLIVLTRRSEELARQQLEFVAAVSHELRTPLAVIRSAGENLADGVVHDETQVRKYGELVRAEGRRLSEMVEQILEFAGIQSGQRGFARGRVAISPLVEEVVSASQSLIDQAGIRVEVELPADLPPVVGDQAALRRVFQNLIGNAIKYGASGGWIGVSATRSGSHVTIAVRDRGIGIAPAEQAHIFEPFYRAADVIAARIQGAGLGLSLVQRIVDGHGGRVTVKSEPEAGTEFIVVLPAAGGDAAETVRTAQHSAEAVRPS